MTSQEAIEIANEILTILHIKYLVGKEGVALKLLILDIDRQARKECVKMLFAYLKESSMETERGLGAKGACMELISKIRDTIVEGEK